MCNCTCDRPRLCDLPLFPGMFPGSFQVMEYVYDPSGCYRHREEILDCESMKEAIKKLTKVYEEGYNGDCCGIRIQFGNIIHYIGDKFPPGPPRLLRDDELID